MDFNDSPEEAAFRAEVRGFLDANATLKTSSDDDIFADRGDEKDLVRRAQEWQLRKPRTATPSSTGPRSTVAATHRRSKV